MNWDAVPEGPGITLLTAEDASRAMSDLRKLTGGVRYRYASANSSRIATAIATNRTTTSGSIARNDSPTPWKSLTLGMIAPSSSTISAPDNAALATLNKTDHGPGRPPVISSDSRERRARLGCSALMAWTSSRTPCRQCHTLGVSPDRTSPEEGETNRVSRRSDLPHGAP